MKTAIIIPTYNERGNIERLIRKICALDLKTDIIVVDDNSPDGTGKIAESIALSLPRVKIIHRPQKLGLGPAYIEVFRKFLKFYDVFIEMDGDFSHPLEALPRFLKEIKENDVVIGSRYIKGGRIKNWSPVRRLISKAGCLYAKTVTGINISDLTGGYVCYRKKGLKKIDLDKVNSNGYAFQIEMKTKLAQRGLKIKEIPITFTERKEGRSKFSWGIVWEAIWKCWQLRLSKH